MANCSSTFNCCTGLTKKRFLGLTGFRKKKPKSVLNLLMETASREIQYFDINKLG